MARFLRKSDFALYSARGPLDMLKLGPTHIFSFYCGATYYTLLKFQFKTEIENRRRIHPN